MNAAQRVVTVLALAVATLIIAKPANARGGYAYASPPSGWSAKSSTAPARFTPQSAGQVFHNGKSVVDTLLNVGGRAITVPAGLRIAANASKFVAGGAFRVGAALAGPGAVAAWFAIAGVTWAVDHWAKSEGTELWSENSGQCVGQPSKQALYACWKAKLEVPPSPGATVVASMTSDNGVSRWVWSKTVTTPVDPFWCSLIGQCSPGVSGQSGIEGFYEKQVGPPKTAPATEADLAPLWTAPIPDEVMPQLQPANVPIPVQLPAINPDADGDPQPLRVPVGAPYQEPDGDPATEDPWKQPVIDVTPDPTESEPWRVDEEPKEIPLDDEEDGLDEPATVKDDDPKGDPTDSLEQQEQLCKAYPDIAACKELGTPSDEDTPLPTKDVPLTITPNPGWGPSTATCPADRTVNTHIAGTIAFSYEPMCTAATAWKPLIVGMAWVTAALGFMGLARKD